ncbi:hypothetical protein CC2G_014907 [Coprinopsis cinerea AmutBmut pab1-1]|nr:hypothetical protein CC2G_014907 [Coprinopsis cinerea AmutBmut pab1-1]
MPTPAGSYPSGDVRQNPWDENRDLEDDGQVDDGGAVFDDDDQAEELPPDNAQRAKGKRSRSKKIGAPVDPIPDSSPNAMPSIPSYTSQHSYSSSVKAQPSSSTIKKPFSFSRSKTADKGPSTYDLDYDKTSRWSSASQAPVQQETSASQNNPNFPSGQFQWNFSQNGQQSGQPNFIPWPVPYFNPFQQQPYFNSLSPPTTGTSDPKVWADLLAHVRAVTGSVPTELEDAARSALGNGLNGGESSDDDLPPPRNPASGRDRGYTRAPPPPPPPRTSRPPASDSFNPLPFDHLYFLRLLAKESSDGRNNSSSFNPFRTALIMHRKGTSVSVSHLPILEKHAHWNEWIGGIRHILRGKNVLGWITLPEENSNKLSPISRPLQPPVITAMSSELDHHAAHIWRELDLFVQHHLLASISPAARRRIDYYVQREGEESLTARVAYQILRDEYGALSYEQGEAAWARLRSLECTNVPGYLARFEDLATEIKDSHFPDASPRAIINTLHYRLPSRIGESLRSIWRIWLASNGGDRAIVPWQMVIDELRSAERLHKELIANSFIFRNTNPRPPNSISSSTALATSSSAPTKPASSTAQTNKQAAVICHNCGAVGHTKATCRKPNKSAYLADEGNLGADELDVIEEITDEPGPDDGGDVSEVDAVLLAQKLGTLSVATNLNDTLDIGCYLSDSELSIAPLPSPPTKEISSYTSFVIWDSGCTQHIIKDRHVFHTFRDISVEIGTAGASPLIANGSVPSNSLFV